MRIDSSLSVEIDLAGSVATNELEFYVSGEDIGGAPYLNNGVTTGTTAITAAASPETGRVRAIQSIVVYNADSASATVSVQINNGSRVRRLVSSAVPAGQSLVYESNSGWQIAFSSTASNPFDQSLNTTDDVVFAAIEGVIGGNTPAAGTFTTLADSKGDARDIPRKSTVTTSYTLVAADSGKLIPVNDTSGGSIEIPNSVFSAGNYVAIEAIDGDVTITCTITTAELEGTLVDVATATLAEGGVCVIQFNSGTACKLIGGSLS